MGFMAKAIKKAVSGMKKPVVSGAVAPKRTGIAGIVDKIRATKKAAPSIASAVKATVKPRMASNPAVRKGKAIS